jgi:3-phenylpropionate/trans-cinnamate dioxygenase ferredoxin reductase subunit
VNGGHQAIRFVERSATVNSAARSEQTVVIVGAGLAGGNAAATLREEGWRGRVVLLGKEPGIPFGRPPLSKTYLRGEEDLTAWYVRPADWYGAHNIDFRTGVTVERLETDLRLIHLAGGEAVSYDRLILCTGGKNQRFEAAGATLPGVFQLRTRAECDAIRQAARPGARAVVVGMGFIGAEVAASLRQMGLDVTVVLSGTAPLVKVLGPEVATALASIHREHGVKLLTGDHVTGIEGNGQAERVLTAQGARLECDLVAAGVGIVPNVDVLVGSSIALNNGILVNAQCQTNVPHVFAAGDVANIQHPIFGQVRVEHYNNAERQGRAVARAVLGDPQAFDYIYSFWSDQYEHNLEYVGFAQTWEKIVLRGTFESRRFLAFYLRQGTIQAVFGLNRGGDPEIEADSELRACQDLIRARVPVTDADLADEQVDLRSLHSA